MAQNNDYIYEAVSSIRDKTIEKMEQTKTPPYPKYYRKIFEEVMASDTDETLAKIYDRIKNRDEADETLFNRYIDLVKLSMDSFSGSCNSLQEIVETQGEAFEAVMKDDNDRAFGSLVEIMTTFQSKILDELAHAEEKILTLENRLQETIAETMLDPLTKTFNRKALEIDLGLAIQAGGNKDLDTYILMIDGDDFKVINDTHGHLIGDKILIFMATTIRGAVRSDNRVYRYGGEEFVVILRDVGHENAMTIADRIRSKIESSRLIYGEETIGFTVSVGIAPHKKEDTFETFLKRADDALYKAKDKGKNCVFSA